jgi:hypothetical protein
MSRPQPEPPEIPSTFVPSGRAREQPRRQWPFFAAIVLAVVAVVAAGIMVAWPGLKLKPAPLDQVEQVAANYLKAMTAQDTESLKKLGTVEEPPAIRSVRSVTRNRAGDHEIKGSFAPLGKLHSRIESEYAYDGVAGRFKPKNEMGAAAETLDKLHKAKDEAEKSGLYKKMQSGDPNDLFDAAEQFGKVFTQLAEGALAPKKILPTYRMLVQESKPPLPPDAKSLALEVSAASKDWTALLKRSFHTLKSDGPFILEQAEVTALATDRLASSGDPPTRLKLTLIRFRLEAIDSGWKVISVRRVLPADEASPPASRTSSLPTPPNAAATSSPNDESARSLHETPAQQ